VIGMVSRSNGYIPLCIPTRAYKVPAGPDWVHEIKHDSYRLQVRRDGDATVCSSGDRLSLLLLLQKPDRTRALRAVEWDHERRTTIERHGGWLR
jgi:hypothetical protein